MKKSTLFLTSAILIVLTSSCISKQEKMETRLKKFISAFEEKTIPLYREMSLTSWDANISGSDESWKKSEKASFSYQKVFKASIT